MHRLYCWSVICTTVGIMALSGQGVQAQGVRLQPGTFNNDIPTFVYDPATGDVAFYGDGSKLTTLEIVSSDGIFMPENVNAGVLGPPFDVLTVAKLFHLNTSGFESIQLGPVLARGLTYEYLSNDLIFNGSVRPTGLLQAIDMLVVPEPAGFGMMLMLAPILSRYRPSARMRRRI
jgi:hypothetical protein